MQRDNAKRSCVYDINWVYNIENEKPIYEKFDAR